MQHCIEKINNLRQEETSSIINEAMMEQTDGLEPSSEVLEKLAEKLDLCSNQELLIEAVTLEKMKDNAEQIENNTEAEYLNQIISLVTYMHERLVMLMEAKISSPVPVPPDFCCPLSLELMKDPVIVSTGQTYERAFIKNWIDLGLTVCPKTRQSLAHTNLIPNYTVKALISHWCESNNVKQVDPIVLSTSEDSFSSDITCSKNLDILRISEMNLDNMNEMRVDSDFQESMSPPSRRESSNDFSQDSNAILNEDFSQAIKGGDNNSSLPLDNSVNSIDATRNASPLSDLASPASLKSRSQILGIWKQPSKNLKLASPPVSPSGIEIQVLNLAKDLKSSSIDSQRQATSELRLLSEFS